MNAPPHPSDMLAAATSADPRWQAIVLGDRQADGRFVYGVRTTGVYCRPSCGARLPRPENVCFHATPEAAEAAGFRACKRCRPHEAGDAQAMLVAAACRRIERSAVAPSLTALAAGANLSPHHFHRVFKAHTGVTPAAYAAAQRDARVRERLAAGDEVTASIYEAGFNSGSRFYDRADAVLGMTPSRYRDGGKDTAIRFAVGQSSLGAVLVAATQLGVCAILLGDDPEVLLRDLQDRFPAAKLLGGDAAFEDVVARAIGLVERPSRGFDLPLDVRGTAFQRRVWDALRAIPAGMTLSYSDVAARIGAHRAVRAVAGACAANAIAIAIPCHRVVRRDANAAGGGYRWGIERKLTLLEREAAE